MKTPLAITLFLLVGAVLASEAPSHERPYFMPRSEVLRLRRLIATQDWAKADYDRARREADADKGKGNGYWSAFLYALDGGEKDLERARAWLLNYANKGWEVRHAGKRLADPEFFKKGQGGIPSVYYRLDLKPMVAFDWAYNGLTAAERQTIRDGLLTAARYKMRCMDRWTQTPNLVFKPTFVVAMTGLATQDPECLAWGFHRKPESKIGGYFPVLNNMLLEGGPWREAPIYPIAHKSLFCMATLARYRRLYDGRDWFRARTPNGSSPMGLMQYYIDSAYPIERTGHGPGQIRVATYGDGATNAKGDLFLVNPANAKKWDMHEALITSYNTSGDPGLAPFVAMVPDYRPNLLDRRPLPPKFDFPPAPSKVWPQYGLAMLRSDESPGYWTNPKAISVFQLMSQGYGHDHRDKFSLTLHGAGRLFYPDYNAIQYENPAIGWTRNTISHNTLMVDEGEARNTNPTIRHEFSPEVKYLATAASGVFEGVDQTRVLMLTGEYLLDVFQAASPTPRTYDYMLHSLGQAQPVEPQLFQPSTALAARYWLMTGQMAMRTDKAWALDFVIKDEPGSLDGNYGAAWYDHTAKLRVQMAAAPGTLVVHGLGMQGVPMLVARRAARRDVVFALAHEPYANADTPVVRDIRLVAAAGDAVVVRLEAEEFIDYAAVSFGPQKDRPVRQLYSASIAGAAFAFRDYGHLRLWRDGRAVGRGGWTGFRAPALAARSRLVLNGKRGKTKQRDGLLAFGQLPTPMAPPPSASESPLTVQLSPAVIRLAHTDRREALLTIENALKKPVSGRVEFALPAGLACEPASPRFGPLAPGTIAKIPVAFETIDADIAPAPGPDDAARILASVGTRTAPGKRLVPYRIVYQEAEGAERSTLALPAWATVGPVLQLDYRGAENTVYQVNAPRYVAEFDMLHGLCRRLVDDSGALRLDGTPLFTFGDGKRTLLDENAKHTFTWIREAPARLIASIANVCRYHVYFGDDRMTIKMSKAWTQFETTQFAVPGQWLSPGGPARWQRIVGLTADGREVDVKPNAGIPIVAAELAFPGASWHLALAFDPPQKVSFEGAGLRFPLGSLTGDAWSLGFCRPDGLDDWRKRE